MSKSLGDKRNEISEAQIRDLTRLYTDFTHDDTSSAWFGRDGSARICSIIFDNQDFLYLKIKVERPLRLNFQASPERIQRLWGETQFTKLAESQKRKHKGAAEKEIAEGEATQQAILKTLAALDGSVLYKDRKQFEKVLKKAFKAAGLSLKLPEASPVQRRAQRPERAGPFRGNLSGQQGQPGAGQRSAGL